jgi:acylphosphatase
MLVRRHYIVRGRVQGVGFRFFTEQAALRERLSGWVRNTPHGDVEVDVEGEVEAVDRFELAIGRGPSGALVVAVNATEETPTGRVTGFMVRG